MNSGTFHKRKQYIQIYSFKNNWKAFLLTKKIDCYPLLLYEEAPKTLFGLWMYEPSLRFALKRAVYVRIVVTHNVILVKRPRKYEERRKKHTKDPSLQLWVSNSLPRLLFCLAVGLCTFVAHISHIFFVLHCKWKVLHLISPITKILSWHLST